MHTAENQKPRGTMNKARSHLPGPFSMSACAFENSTIAASLAFSRSVSLSIERLIVPRTFDMGLMRDSRKPSIYWPFVIGIKDGMATD
jgi:hypothetical protein